MIDPATYQPKCGWCRSAHVGDAIACVCVTPCSVGYCLADLDGSDPFAVRMVPGVVQLQAPDAGSTLLAVQPGLGR